MKSRLASGAGTRPGFTLLELLVSMTILTVILFVTATAINQLGTVWRRTSGKISSFQEARAAFETITRKVSQATLNTYWDYVDSDGNGPQSAGYSSPSKYARQSELHFICGPAQGLLGGNNLGHSVFFQAPLGYATDSSTDSRLSNRLNASGFFIQYGVDTRRPGFIRALYPSSTPSRFRLMEMFQTTENLEVYRKAGDPPAAIIESASPSARHTWFVEPITASPSMARPIAENILALVLMPRKAEDPADATSLTDNYSYDTKAYNSASGPARIADPARNQLPPLVQVAMVAIDAESAERFDWKYPSFTAIPSEVRSLFADTSDYRVDLDTLESFLQAERFNYRVFTTNVSIRQAKWSEQ